MIRLFDRRRTGLLAGVLGVAMVQLGATIVVAHALHGPDRSALALAAIAAVIGFGCEALLRRLSEGLGIDYVTAVRADLFRHLMQVEPEVVRRRRHGAMLQSFVGDLTALRQWVAEGIMRAILALVALAGLLGWLALTQPTLALAASAVVVLSTAAGAALLPRLARNVRAVRRQRGQVSAFASERLAASATVLACGRTESEARRLARRVNRHNRAALRRAWYTGLLRALPHLATTAIVIAAVLTADGSSTGGMAGLVLVIGIIGLALRDLARAAELAVPGRISRQRLARMLALPRFTPGPVKPWMRGQTRRLVIDRLELLAGDAPFSANAGQGEVVLLAGDPKRVEALFRVIAGLGHPRRGTIRWNGMDLLATEPKRRSKTVGLASPDLPVLRVSNGLNIRYRNARASELEVAELAQAWHIDPLAGDGDPALLVVLRALLGQPPVLLLAPDDRSLDDAAADRLARTITEWPGVVLLASCHPRLVHTANRRWELSAAGLAEGTAGALVLAQPEQERAA